MYTTKFTLLEKSFVNHIPDHGKYKEYKNTGGEQWKMEEESRDCCRKNQETNNGADGEKEGFKEFHSSSSISHSWWLRVSKKIFQIASAIIARKSSNATSISKVLSHEECHREQFLE